MPITCGNSCFKFEKVDHYLIHSSPLIEYKPNFEENPVQLAIETKIGHFLSRLIEDGSTLNIGLGKIPPRIWHYLKKKSDLAIYSEVLIITDKLIELIKDGVVNCAKNHYPHIMCSFILGRQKHYQYLSNNPFFELHPTKFINDLFNIAKNHKLVSLYSAIAVDLFGNITNHFKNKLYSGVGGEYDFIQGTALADMGKTIIIIPSTAVNQSISRIVPSVEKCTISASDVHYVVTEWGIARLGGKSIRERALQLIGIAHPKFRKQLLHSAKQMNLIYKDQLLPMTRSGNVVIYPDKYEWVFQSETGQHIQFRPAKPTDEELYQRFFYDLNFEDRTLRFLAPKKIFPHEQTQKDINIDYHANMVILGLVGDEDRKKIVCIGSYNSDPALPDDFAEIAITVARKWQKRGLGQHIFEKLIDIAIGNDIKGFFGELSARNRAMLAILSNLPYKVQYDYHEDTIMITIDFQNQVE